MTTENESTAIATIPGHTPPVIGNGHSATLAFEPSDMASAYKLSEVLVASRMLPRAIATPEAAFAVIMAGRELGLTAMQSLRSIHIIEGKPTMSADLMVALCKKSPICRYFTVVETTNTVATYETHRIGEEKPTRISFSMEDAKAAQVATKENWKKFPAAMLRARASAALCRAVYPDLMLGVYDTDEIAPQPQRVPEVVVAVRQVEATPVRNLEAEARAIVNDLEDCSTSAEIDALSKQAAKAGFTGELRTRVAEAFTARRAALATVAA